MTDIQIEETFKKLIYIFGECNWEIIKDDAWNEYINNDKPFNEKQLQELRDFLTNLEIIK